MDEILIRHGKGRDPRRVRTHRVFFKEYGHAVFIKINAGIGKIPDIGVIIIVVVLAEPLLADLLQNIRYHGGAEFVLVRRNILITDELARVEVKVPGFEAAVGVRAARIGISRGVNAQKPARRLIGLLHLYFVGKRTVPGETVCKRYLIQVLRPAGNLAEEGQNRLAVFLHLRVEGVAHGELLRIRFAFDQLDLFPVKRRRERKARQLVAAVEQHGAVIGFHFFADDLGDDLKPVFRFRGLHRVSVRFRRSAAAGSQHKCRRCRD